MDASTDRTDGHAGMTRGQRVGQWLAIALLALVIGAALYYALTIIRSTTFSTDRGFRVLNESIGEFENLQNSLASLLKLVPDIDCADGQGAQLNQCLNDHYQSRLDIPGVRLEKWDDRQTSTFCSESRREEFLLRSSESRVAFTIYPCSLKGDDKLGQNYVIQGNFARALERFHSQRFFDETVFALNDGAIVAALTAGADERIERERLQHSNRRTLVVADASHLLERAVEAASSNAAQPAAKAGGSKPALRGPALPVVFSETIAGQKYRVFVVPFRSQYSVYTPTHDAGAFERVEHLYVIAIKRERFVAALAYALWPNGTFLITIGALLAMLLWPLAGLRLSAPQDPITRTEALGIMAAALLVPALLTIFVVWLWSHATLRDWADAGAQRYAVAIERHLIEELQTATHLLEEYRRAVFAPEALDCSGKGGECHLPSALPLRRNERQPHEWLHVPLTQHDSSDCCGMYFLWTESGAQPLGNWSILRTALAVDGTGEKIGPRLSAFGEVPQAQKLNIGDRPYFEVLKDGAGWAVSRSDAWTDPPMHQFVAQRLFSRADAARTLQIAVPRCELPSVFCGIVTGDTRVHAITAAIDPPLLRFAVIDRDSGTVLFHSDDSRSLAENFFTETEHEAQLQAALRLGEDRTFSGRYVGDPHRFFFHPMQGTSWGIVVFYSMKTLGDLPLQAGVAALTAYAGIALVLIVVFGAVLFSKGSIARRVLGMLWPQWRWRANYVRFGWMSLGLVLATMIVALALLRTDHGYAALSAAAMVPIASTWLLTKQGQRALSRAAAMPLHAYEQAYIRCILGVLLFLAVLPAAWLALSFHDAQVQGLLREAAHGAGMDVERRRALIEHDLQRWVPDQRARLQRYPDASTLAQVDVPGFHFAAGTWTSDLFVTMPWGRLAGPLPLGPWRQRAWLAAAQTPEQLRRIALLDVESGTKFASCTHRRAQCYASTATDGKVRRIAIGVAAADQSDGANVKATLLLLLAGVITCLASARLANLVARRFFGVGLPFSARFVPVLSTCDPTLGAVLLYRAQTGHSMSGSLAPEVLGATLDAMPRDRRIDLSSIGLQPFVIQSGNYLLLNLDIALLERERRWFVLEQLERMLARLDIGVFVSCERQPTQWLYRADAFPETRAEHRPDLQEELRWDNVFALLTMIDLRRGEQATDRRVDFAPVLRDARLSIEALRQRHRGEITDKDAADYVAAQADMHYHRAWKLCTRDERLLLHQLATRRFANPANHRVTERLIRAGFVTLDPWPRLSDAGFARFVRTAETRRDFADWQRAASQSAWHSVRAPLLILLVVMIGWLMWTAGDYVQAFSAVLIGAIALLGRLGEIVNLVRGGAK